MRNWICIGLIAINILLTLEVIRLRREIQPLRNFQAGVLNQVYWVESVSDDELEQGMSHPSKVKGSSFERELVNHAIEHGLTAKRAYASNGESLPGCTAEVDCLIGGEKVQAKRRKSIASYLQIPEGCDAVAFREDRGETLVLISWERYLELLK